MTGLEFTFAKLQKKTVEARGAPLINGTGKLLFRYGSRFPDILAIFISKHCSVLSLCLFLSNTHRRLLLFVFVFNLF